MNPRPPYPANRVHPPRHKEPCYLNMAEHDIVMDCRQRVIHDSDISVVSGRLKVACLKITVIFLIIDRKRMQPAAAFRMCRSATAEMMLESSPPDRNVHTGTSETSWR